LQESHDWTFVVSSGKTFARTFAKIERRKIAAPRSVCCRDCRRVSWRPIRKRRQRDSDATLEPDRLPGIRCGRFTAACHHSGYAGCFRRILAIASAGLANRLVEHRCRNSRNHPGFPSYEVHRSAAFVDRHWNFGTWVRSFFFVFTKRKKYEPSSLHPLPENRPSYWRLRLVLIATAVGIVSGLLANAGGFLLAPAYARFLRQPIKKSFACSLAVSAVLAAPGTVVHAYLGHISWMVTGLVALGSVPFSYLGARIAIRTKASRLERLYGIVLTALGAFFLYQL
jgi:Sulfite exporter TauE/SafE